MTNSDEWKPLVALPNVEMRGTVECDFAAIVPPTDPRIQKLWTDHPRLQTFLSKFRGQHGAQVWPSVLLIRADAPKTYYTAEAVTAFRDVVSMSVVPYARSSRLRFERANALAFSTGFRFYPWMIDAKFDELILTNPAENHFHVLDQFNGQTFPEQSPVSVMGHDVDMPLAKALLTRWEARYADDNPTWENTALFRSMNMANEASGVPAPMAATVYDVGRSLALWVSAYEILVHPGEGISNFWLVASKLEAVKWQGPKLSETTYPIPGKPPKQMKLGTWVCRQIYDRRDDFLHGNKINPPEALLLSEMPIIDFAACLYRMLLTNFLDLYFDLPIPSFEDAKVAAEYISDRGDFNRYQRAYEEALLKAIPKPDL